MESDWNETTRVTASNTTTFAFDPLQELLWTGNEHVSVCRLPIWLRKPAYFTPYVCSTHTHHRAESLHSTDLNCNDTHHTEGIVTVLGEDRLEVRQSASYYFVIVESFQCLQRVSIWPRGAVFRNGTSRILA